MRIIILYNNKKVMRYAILIIVIFNALTKINATLAAKDYGLHFSTDTKEPTSLFLENNQPYGLSEDLTVQFDLQISGDNLFGLIFTVCTAPDKYIFLRLAVNEKKQRIPALVIDEEIYELSSSIVRDKWIPISLSFSVADKMVKVNYDGVEKSLPYPLEKSGSLQFFFGAFQHVISDVASMNLRNVKVWKGDKMFRYWKLERYYENMCFDELAQVPAIAENPHWLIDRHISWKPVFTYESDDLLGITFDPRYTDFYLLARNNIMVYNPLQNSKKYLPVRGGYAMSTRSNYLTFDTLHNQLLSYELNGGKISHYSFSNQRWSSDIQNGLDFASLKHTRAYCSADSSYYMFGGYGFYRYNNVLLKLNPSTGRVDTVNYVPLIPSRASAASAIVGTTLYIFGGWGNESGRQEVLAHNYYDLHAIDLETYKSRKLWTVAADEDGRMGLAPTMYYSESDSAFYVATTTHSGRLMKLSLKDSTFLSVSRPMQVAGKIIDFDLYEAPDLDRMYVVQTVAKEGDMRKVIIHSLSLPVLPISEIVQQAGDENSGFEDMWLIGALISTGVLALCLFYFVRQKKSANKKEMTIESSTAEIQEEKHAAFEDAFVTQKQNEVYFFDRSKSSISLLGNFCVCNKEGVDITSQFTPRLKNLLVLLILHNSQDRHGILPRQLDELLWYDKDEISARNNRNVALRNLRVLLGEVGDIEIVKDNELLCMRLGEDVFCDYQEVYCQIREFVHGGEYVEEKMEKIFELLSYGPLLTNLSFDFIDSFKSTYSMMILEFLNKLLKIDDLKSDLNFVYRIANIMSLYDALDEEALALKCSVLCSMGKKRIAKGIYDEFNRSYKKLLGEDFRIPFENLYKI